MKTPRLIMGIDPGTIESAFVVWDSVNHEITEKQICPNEEVLDYLQYSSWVRFDLLAIEMIESYGMAVGKETFETVLWIGRFIEAARHRNLVYSTEFQLVHRKVIKLHHCGSIRAKDKNIRQALIDKYGKPGTKKAQGKTYGLKSHLWQAFAAATAVSENAEMKVPKGAVNETDQTADDQDSTD